MFDLDRSDHETSGPDEHDEHWLKMAQWQNEAEAWARGAVQHTCDDCGGTFAYVVNVVDPDEPGLVLCRQCWDRHWRKARDEAQAVADRDDEIGITYPRLSERAVRRLLRLLTVLFVVAFVVWAASMVAIALHAGLR